MKQLALICFVAAISSFTTRFNISHASQEHRTSPKLGIRSLALLARPHVAALAAGVAVSDIGPEVDSLSITSPNLEGRRFDCSTSGVQAALAALPAAGGFVDASACPNGGTVEITSTIYVGSNAKNVILLLGAGTYSGSANPLFLVHARSRLIIPMATVVRQTAPSATAIIVAGGESPTAALAGGIEGTGVVLGPGHDTTGIGLVIGGTSDAGNDPGNAANFIQIGAITVSGFGIGEKYGNNVYVLDHEHTLIAGNGTSVLFPPGLSQCCENIAYHGALFSAATSTPADFVISQGGLDLTLDSCSLDQADLVLNATSPSLVRVYGGHFEKPVGASSTDFIQMSGSNHFVELHGVLAVEDYPSSRREFFSDKGGHLRIFGGSYLAAQKTAQLVYARAPGTVEIYGPNGNNIEAEINRSFAGGYIISNAFFFGVGSPGMIKTNGNVVARFREPQN